MLIPSFPLRELSFSPPLLLLLLPLPPPMPTSSPSPSSHLTTTRRPNASSSTTRKDSSMKASNGHAASKNEKAVRYRECRKNHAASIGGYAVDGCREFMASGEEGTTAALRCAACSCHRSFHKREVEPAAAADTASHL